MVEDKMKNISSNIILTILIFSACANSTPPYYEFETKLKDAVCNCVRIGSQNLSAERFSEEYRKCQEETSSLLKTGLDEYKEDSRMTKDEYISKLDIRIQQIAADCKRDY